MTVNIERNQGIYVVDDCDLKEPSSVPDELVEKNAAKIVEIKKQIFDLLAEAESLADEANLQFNISICYGMGGTYFPIGMNDDILEESQDGWMSSSMMC